MPIAPRRRSRIAHFKAPFIISVAGSAALGCGGRADPVREPAATTDTSLTNGETELECPAALPVNGEPCARPASEACEYALDGCPIEARCTGGAWQREALAACNPPRPIPDPDSTLPAPDAPCPELQPEPGSSCAEHAPGLTCEYDFCGGPVPMTLCGEQAVWEELPLPSCNPPWIPTCPESLPEAGSDCVALEQVCEYPGGCEPEPSTAVCHHYQWVVEYSSGPACNPPAVIPVCPTVEPGPGAGCAYEGQGCGYGTCGDAGDPRRGRTCTDGIWQELEPPCDAG